MRALVSGASGTVGNVLCMALRRAGHDVFAYARGGAGPDDADHIAQQLERARPSVVYHLAIASRPSGIENEGWRVNVEWPAALALQCAAAGVCLVFTSTVMVFSDQARGPFTIDSPPDATVGYGYEKRVAEERVRAASGDVRIARLGWQIGEQPGGNQMLTHLDAQAREHGGVMRASRRWLPACSFLPDTAAALLALPELPTGLYHVNSNTRWSYFDIVMALNRRRGSPWRVEPDDAFIYDQRMLETRIALPPLEAALPELLV